MLLFAFCCGLKFISDYFLLWMWLICCVQRKEDTCWEDPGIFKKCLQNLFSVSLENVKVGHWSVQFAYEEILTKITSSAKSRETVEAWRKDAAEGRFEIYPLSRNEETSSMRRGTLKFNPHHPGHWSGKNEGGQTVNTIENLLHSLYGLFHKSGLWAALSHKDPKLWQ